jgi:hypothetical protein
LRLESAGCLLRVKGGNLVRGVDAGFESARESASFCFAAERYRMLIKTDLPLGFCQFFYQDLHSRSPLVKDVTQKTASQEIRL